MILGDNEKRGGALRLVRQMKEFHEVIRECGFLDMPYLGAKVY